MPGLYLDSNTDIAANEPEPKTNKNKNIKKNNYNTDDDDERPLGAWSNLFVWFMCYPSHSIRRAFNNNMELHTL